MSVLLTGLHRHAQSAVELPHLLEEQRENRKSNIAVKIKKLAVLKESHSQMVQQIKDLYERYALGYISKEKYFTEKTTAAEQRDSLSVQIDELETELMNTSEDGKLNNHFVSNFQNCTEITREILTDVIEEILVNPGGRLEIVWNYQDDFERILEEGDVQDIREKKT